MIEPESCPEKPVTLWIALVAFGLAVLAVNPLRETALDDDWAYALTVQHLLQTGQYRLHDWAAPNLLFQVCWGGLFARVFGFSHSILRVSTLVLVLVGLVALYGLAREHGLRPNHAGLIALALVASPLVFVASLDFMTDGPFLTGLILSLWLYARAFRRESSPLMLLASLAACAAIFMRQFGVALVGGLALLWALDEQRIQRARLYLSGTILPAAAGAWQIAAGMLSPNWAARWRMRDQLEYLSHAKPLAATLLWRPTVILQYLALFILPLALLALPSFFLSGSRRPGGAVVLERRSRIRNVLLLGAVCVALALGLEHGQDVNPRHGLMPLLPHSFEILLKAGLWGRGLITLLTSLGAVLLGGAIVRRYWAPPEAWRGLPRGLRLLDLVTLCLLGLHLAYADFTDDYLLVFLPFALIVLGRHLREWWDRLLVPATVGCLALLAVSAIWTCGLLAEEEALWRGGDLALQQAAGEPRRVNGSWTWNCFHGAFDDYLAEIRHQVPKNGLRDFFNHYLVRRAEAADYVVYSDEPGRPAGAEAARLAEIAYRDQILRRRSVYVERRHARRILGAGPMQALRHE